MVAMDVDVNGVVVDRLGGQNVAKSCGCAVEVWRTREGRNMVPGSLAA